MFVLYTIPCNVTTFFSLGNLKEFSDEDSNFTALLQKAMDMDGIDRDTVFQLVALLMKVCIMLYMCNPV